MINGVERIIPNVDKIIISALEEDITNEDITTNSIISPDSCCKAELICKQDGVLSGINIFKRTFELLSPNIKITTNYKDGDLIKKSSVIAVISGNARTVLTGERTALNFLQRMSGIATLTKSLSDELKDTSTKLLDTRKTTPNMRILEKYAVTCGGGYNHRFNLSDGILIKDNHISAAGGIKNAISLARKHCSFVRKIEVETENLDMVLEALEAGADIIMLDNMDDNTIKEAVALINHKALTECSGNVTKERLKALAKMDIDYISCGALTHSAPILDFSLKHCTLI